MISFCIGEQHENGRIVTMAAGVKAWPSSADAFMKIKNISEKLTTNLHFEIFSNRQKMVNLKTQCEIRQKFNPKKEN